MVKIAVTSVLLFTTMFCCCHGSSNISYVDKLPLVCNAAAVPQAEIWDTCGRAQSCGSDAKRLARHRVEARRQAAHYLQI